MTLKSINEALFKVTSLFPIIWISTLYLFLFTCIVDLGHYPIPTVNDPYGIGSGFLYGIAWIGFFAVVFGSICWWINLIIAAYYQSIPLKHLFLFIIGISACLMQVIYDPGSVLFWFLD